MSTKSKKPVALIKKWKVPSGGGAPHLCQPNIPHPLHGLAPRIIVGPTEWNRMRRECYEACERRCEICGEACLPGKMDAHELYDFDYESKSATFVRLIGLCKTCHGGVIHSGRAITMYKQQMPLWTEDVLIRAAEHGFRLVSRWNKQHPDDEPLRMFATFLDWMKVPTLGETIQNLATQYDIEFYDVPPTDGKDDWGQWKLVFNQTEYYSPYAIMAEWQAAMVKNNAREEEQNKDLFDKAEMDRLAEAAAESGIF